MFQLDKFLLILMRITAFVVTTPGFSYRGIPNSLKIGFSVALGAIIYMMTPDFVLEGNSFLFLFLVIKEVFVGLALGFVCQVVFSVMEMAGNLVDFQAGFSMAAVYDPILGAQTSNFGRLYYWIAIASFFLLDLHQFLLSTVMRSFTLIPLGNELSKGLGAEGMLVLFYRMFELGILLAAPILLCLLVTDSVLGIISRTVPQINVFMLGMPMKAMVSFFIFFLSAAWVLNFAGDALSQIPQYLEGMVSALRP